MSSSCKPGFAVVRYVCGKSAPKRKAKPNPEARPKPETKKRRRAGLESLYVLEEPNDDDFFFDPLNQGLSDEEDSKHSASKKKQKSAKKTKKKKTSASKKKSTKKKKKKKYPVSEADKDLFGDVSDLPPPSYPTLDQRRKAYASDIKDASPEELAAIEEARKMGRQWSIADRGGLDNMSGFAPKAAVPDADVHILQPKRKPKKTAS